MTIPTGTTPSKINPGFIALLFITVLFGVATPAAATPYVILIENPDVWKITGSFDSNRDIWVSPNEISNWSFTAEVLMTPAFSVGPIIDTNPETTLATFRGSTLFGIEEIFVASNLPVERIEFMSDPISREYITLITSTTEGDFKEDGMTNTLTNTASVVPEPTTALLFLTGLAGLVGHRWQHARRQTK